ncbi:MAG: folate-binding protein YgfZ [Thermoleophilaceae bacterium]|nr:folate-binding protein YgfZ [Thermoleophilaceae bacterium]
MSTEQTTGFLRAEDPGVLVLRGDDAGEFLNGQVTNDVGSLADGESRYALLLTPKGKMRADMWVARDGDETLVVTSATHLPVIQHTVDAFRIGYFFSTEDATGEFVLVKVIGPGARDAVDAISIPVVELESPMGVDALVESGEAAALLAQLRGAGLSELTSDQYRTARVEYAVPAFGTELNDETFPAEASLESRAVSFDKGCYVGQETVARMHWKGRPNRHLRILRSAEPLTTGAPVVLADGKELGLVGTATVATTGEPIALAILRREAEPGSRVSAGGIDATIVEVPETSRE